MTLSRHVFGISLCCLTVYVVLGITPSQVLAKNDWPATGKYLFTDWEGPPLAVYYTIPPEANAQTRVVIVIPGAKRNAGQYRDEWSHLANANGFITLVIGASKKRFPTEYEYNVGGVINAAGDTQPAETWLYSAIDPIFDKFKNEFGSSRKTYSLYGHSAGGGFVLLFLLFEPHAKVDRAVAANPAFFTMPDEERRFPFGLKGAPLSDRAVNQWFKKRFVLLLGGRDRDPRTQPLSNGPEAQQQGPHVFARGLGFYQAALSVAKSEDLSINWQLEVVPGVGHSNAHLASHAVKYLLDD